MSMCRVISCVVGKGCLLWSVCSFDKILLAFVLLHFVLQGQTFLLFWVSLDFLFLDPNLLWWKLDIFDISFFVFFLFFFFFLVLFLSVVGLHRTSQPWVLTDFSFLEPSTVEALQVVEWYLQAWMCNKNRLVKRLWELKNRLFQSYFSFFVSNHFPSTSHCTPERTLFLFSLVKECILPLSAWIY